MANWFSLILSIVVFVWEFISLGRECGVVRPDYGAGEAALSYVRMIFIFICLPVLWIFEALKFFGWLPWNDMDTPSVFQMKLFAWTINALLTVVFVWKVLEGIANAL